MNAPDGHSSNGRDDLDDTTAYRRASGLVMRWIDDDPTHRLVENTQRGTEAALGPHEIALLDLFGTGRRLEEVLAILLPGDAEEAHRKEARAEILRAVARLINRQFLVRGSSV